MTSKQSMEDAISHVHCRPSSPETAIVVAVGCDCFVDEAAKKTEKDDFVKGGFA